MDLSPHELITSQLHILVLGRTGSGKSTLINTMLGDHLALQSYSVLPTQHDTVEIHKCTIGELQVFIYDTPGFFDCRISTNELLFRLKTSFPNRFDLVILCHRIIDRFDETTIAYLDSFCKHFHKQQQNVIVALTFTNFLLAYPEVSDLKYNEAKIEILKRKTIDFKLLFNKTSTKILDGINFFENIPFVMVGSSRERSLPTTRDWLSELWYACYQQCPDKVKTLVNILRYQLCFNTAEAKMMPKSLCGIVSLVASTSIIVPALSDSIDMTMSDVSHKYRVLRMKKLPKTNTLHEINEREENNSHVGVDQEQRKETQRNLPSVRPEELSSDIFEALGLK